MSTLIDSSVQYLYNALHLESRTPDMVRFRTTNVPCWRCEGNLEAYYCERRTFAVRCNRGCPGVFLVTAGNFEDAAKAISGTAKSGRWTMAAGFTVCSECGASPADWEAKPDNPRGLPPYCHSCGTRMDAEDTNVLTKDGGAKE